MSSNSCSPAVFDPFKIDLVVVEELSDHDVSSCLALFLEILNVIFSALCLEMHLRVASHHDTEEVPIFFLDELNEVDRTAEAVLSWCPVLDSEWWVSSQSQDVPDIRFLCSVQRADYVISRHSGTRDMHQNLKAHVLRDVTTELNGCLAEPILCSPRQVDPEWVGRAHSCNSVYQIFLS
jgi:hypothetical protein